MLKIVYQTLQIETDAGGRFNLCGLRCNSHSWSDLPQALLDMDPSLFTIAAVHFPEAAEALAAANVDLILSVNGCSTACADLRPFESFEIHTITSLKDSNKFIKKIRDG